MSLTWISILKNKINQEMPLLNYLFRDKQIIVSDVTIIFAQPGECPRRVVAGLQRCKDQIFVPRISVSGAQVSISVNFQVGFGNQMMEVEWANQWCLPKINGHLSHSICEKHAKNKHHWFKCWGLIFDPKIVSKRAEVWKSFSPDMKLHQIM